MKLSGRGRLGVLNLARNFIVWLDFVFLFGSLGLYSGNTKGPSDSVFPEGEKSTNSTHTLADP